MHITPDMIHPQLRFRGGLIRFVMPSFTLPFFRLAGVGIKALKGRGPRGLHYEQVFIPRPDGSQLRLCLYGPKTPPREPVPGLLWVHGGGYALGAPEQDTAFIKRFVRECGCFVVSPDYRLSLEQPYPAALEDCYAALLWLKAQGPEHGVRPDQLIVGGESAGGGLTAALSLYARDKGEVSIAFQMPLYPMLDDRMETASAKDNDAPLWNSRSNALGWQLYLGALAGQPDIPAYAAPARTPSFSGLPPTITYVGSIEPFRDETLSYVESLRAHGIPVYFRLFEGCYHGFDIVCSGSSVAKEATAFLMESFRAALSRYAAPQP